MRNHQSLEMMKKTVLYQQMRQPPLPLTLQNLSSLHLHRWYIISTSITPTLIQLQGKMGMKLIFLPCYRVFLNTQRSVTQHSLGSHPSIDQGWQSVGSIRFPDP